jgi:hypothetical protein
VDLERKGRTVRSRWGRGERLVRRSSGENWGASRGRKAKRAWLGALPVRGSMCGRRIHVQLLGSMGGQEEEDSENESSAGGRRTVGSPYIDGASWAFPCPCR